jgi:hypothetical protein
MGEPRKMRRGEKEITDAAELEEVLGSVRTLVVGFSGEEAPYLVPLSFGWDGRCLYIHSGPSGRKMELLGKDPRVGFAASEEPVIVPGEASCSFSVRSRSVVGQGTIRIVSGESERLRGLDAIMRHYTSQAPSYDPAALAKTVVLAIDVREMRGKRTG